jgi:1-deoxy-D-xylulose-5-phosphate reductoisomerase
MKKKIIILGSTGSIGQKTLKILRKDKKNFQISLLSTNKNISKVVNQALEFNVKFIIVTDYKKYTQAKKKYLHLNIKFFNSFNILNKIFKKKEIYYSMLSIVGIDGLKPALNLPMLTHNLAIVNKEALVCGWSLIKKKLIRFKTKFIPIDSEHFSINNLLDDKNIHHIKNIYLTASGGPFLNYSSFEKKKITLNKALKHPNWLMGKKISIDSSTMMNKVFEVIEAKNIFDLPYDKIKIIIHPASYVHSIIEFNNSLIKIIAHLPDMNIPIANSIYDNDVKIPTKSVDLKILNNLKLSEINFRQFPLVKIIHKLPKFNSLYETAIITINDYFVEMFLDKKISYLQMINFIKKYTLNEEITKYKKIHVKNINQILKLRNYLSLKLDNLIYKL